MSQWVRFRYGVLATFALAFAGIMYVQIFRKLLYGMATDTHSGPFSHVVVTLDLLAPVVITGLLLAVWAWVLVGGAQEERSRFQVRP